MSFTIPTRPSEAIINLLKQFKRPLDAEEISFRTRSPLTLVNEVIERLLKANMIRMEENGYKLNPPEKYQLQNLLS